MKRFPGNPSKPIQSEEHLTPSDTPPFGNDTSQLDCIQAELHKPVSTRRG